MEQKYYPLGNYIKLCKERNKDLSAKLHWGLSSAEGLIPLPLDKGKTDKRSFWVLREGRFACDLIHLWNVKKFAFSLYIEKEEGIISNGTYVTFEINNPKLNNEYLSLILKSKKTEHILLHFSCHGCEMVLPWEDFCNLLIRVPPSDEQKDLVKKYQVCERLVKLKREINDYLERWMLSLYHLTFDDLEADKYEIKTLKEVIAIRGGQHLQLNAQNIFVKREAFLE